MKFIHMLTIITTANDDTMTSTYPYGSKKRGLDHLHTLANEWELEITSSGPPERLTALGDEAIVTLEQVPLL